MGTVINAVEAEIFDPARVVRRISIGGHRV